MFTHFLRQSDAPNSIITYSDKRWNTGNLYNKLGFVFSHSSAPNYFYSKDGIKLESRIQYQKHKLKKLDFFDKSLSESENMLLNGYKRIFDCGNDVYMWRKGK